jgi:hypothetical protein
MRLGDAEVGQQDGGLGGHRRPAIGVDRELPTVDALAGARLADELLRERGALPMGHHPADHAAAEDIEHHVQVEVGPLRRPEQRVMGLVVLSAHEGGPTRRWLKVNQKNWTVEEDRRRISAASPVP